MRAASANTALLRAAAALAPPGVVITLFDGVADLPHFNPDGEHCAPAAVLHWQAMLQGADAILIACPEYAHGVPGSFKNALDWAVGTAGLEGKPVALLNSSARAGHAAAALAEVVTTMGWRVLDAASVRIPCARKDIDPGAIATMPEFVKPLRAAVLVLAQAARRHASARFCAS